MIRALIVEDEQKVAEALRACFEADGYQVAVERTGEGGFFRLNTELFDVVLLDLTLPGVDGLQLLTSVRQRGLRTPILVLTALDTLGDRVAGLNNGADDYLGKPFALAEVSARVRALLRRGQQTEAAPLRLNVGDMQVDRLARQVTRAGKPIVLTVREFELLDYLARHREQIVSREMLARDVWKEVVRTTSLDNVIDVHIARLRRKLDLNHPIPLIHTVRGVGFSVREHAP